MAYDAHSNFGYSTVATAPSPADSGTTMVFATGEGALMPTPPYNLTIYPTATDSLASNSEIVRVLAQTGDTVTTMTRAQEGTSARSILVGDQCANCTSKKVFTDIEAAADAAAAAAAAITKTSIGLGNVTNDAQTKAAIVPNTAPSAGQILVGNAGGTAFAPVSLSGKVAITSAGVASVTLASGDIPNNAANTSGNAATVTTNANLTGPITSVGNVTTVANDIALPGSPTTTTQTAGDASTKLATTAFVQSAVLQGPAKEAVKYASVAALPSIIYANGSSGVGATLTGVALAAISLDSSSPAVADRVLIKNQASTFQNGIYVVTATGSGIAVFVLTRATDFDQSGDIKTGASTYIVGGATLVGTTFDVNSADNPVMGTDAITFTQTAGPGSVTSGNGITVTGTSIAIDTSVTVDKTTAQTLTNKTLTSPVINGATSSGSTSIDLSGNSGTFKTPTGTTTLSSALTGILKGASGVVSAVTAPSGAIVGDTDTQTLTGKRVTARITTITSNATPTVNTDNCDCVTITALAAAITSMTTNLTGTPVNFDQLEYRIKDDSTARAITWGASFASGPATLPTTTILSKALHVYFEWDSVQAKWLCMSTGSDA